MGAPGAQETLAHRGKAAIDEAACEPASRTRRPSIEATALSRNRFHESKATFAGPEIELANRAVRDSCKQRGSGNGQVDQD